MYFIVDKTVLCRSERKADEKETRATAKPKK